MPWSKPVPYQSPVVRKHSWKKDEKGPDDAMPVGIKPSITQDYHFWDCERCGAWTVFRKDQDGPDPMTLSIADVDTDCDVQLVKSVMDS